MRMKKNSFLYSASLLAASNMILQVLGFVYRIILSRYGGAEGLGVYRLAFSVYLVVNAGCLSGITTACTRLSAEYYATRRRGQIRRLIVIAFCGFYTLVILCGAALFLTHDTVAQVVLGDERTAAAFVPMLLCLALTGIENIFKSVCIGLKQVRFAAVSEIAEQVIRILAVWLLLMRFSNGDHGRLAMLIFMGMAVSEMFSASFLSWCYRHDIRPLTEGGCTGRPEGFWGIALPLSLTALLNNLIGSAGSVLMPRRLRLAGLTEAEAMAELGVVSGMASPLVLLPAALINSVITALMPVLSDAYANKRKIAIQKLAEKGLFVVGMIGAPAVAMILPLAPTLSRLFFGQVISARYMSILGVSAVLMFYQMASGAILNVTGYQRFHICTAVGSELLQLLLMFFLCTSPRLGIYGYLYAALLASLAGALGNFILLRRVTGGVLRLKRLALLPAVCAVTLSLWTKIFYSAAIGVFGSQWAAVVAALVGAGALYLLLLRMLGIRVLQYVRSHTEPMPVLCYFMI